jgi:hypothetical protein
MKFESETIDHPEMIDPELHDEREDEPIVEDVFSSEFDSIDLLKQAIQREIGDHDFKQIRDVRLNKDKDIADSVLVWESGDRFYVIRKLVDGRCWIVSVEDSMPDAYKRSDAFVDHVRAWIAEK